MFLLSGLAAFLIAIWAVDSVSMPSRKKDMIRTGDLREAKWDITVSYDWQKLSPAQQARWLEIMADVPSEHSSK